MPQFSCLPLNHELSTRDPAQVRASFRNTRDFVARWRDEPDADCCNTEWVQALNHAVDRCYSAPWLNGGLRVRRADGRSDRENLADRLSRLVAGPGHHSVFFECGDCSDIEYVSHRIGSVCRNCAVAETERDYDDEERDSVIYDYTTRVQDVIGDRHLFRVAEGENAQPNTLYLGIELEVEARRDYDEEDGANQLLQHAPANYLFCKRDGSLARGFEIVTIPATFRVHHENWSRLLGDDDALSLVQRTHANTGMHVHMSRDAFTPLTLGKFLVFYNHPKNVDFIYAVSGRASYGSFEQWAHQNPDTKITDPLAGPSCNSRFGKYSAVNCNPPETIEVRIFRGSRDKAEFLKNLEFVQASFEFCRETPMKSLHYGDFAKWAMRNARQFPNLCAWLVDRDYAAANDNAASDVSVAA